MGKVECVTRYLDKGIKGRCMVEDAVQPAEQWQSGLSVVKLSSMNRR